MSHQRVTISIGCPGSPTPGVRGRRRISGLALSLLFLASLLVAAGVMASPPASAATSVNVFVAYADNLRSSGFFPTPWKDAPNTLFIGAGPSFDAGAVRLDNPTGASLAVDSVSVDLQRPGPVFNLWGSFTIPAHGSAILTQTGQYNFDTSDFPTQGCPTPASPSDRRIPKVSVTIAGVPTSLLDTGHVLDTGGFDAASCKLQPNESLQWRAIGGAGIGTEGGSITLSPANQTQGLGSTAIVTSTVLDAGGSPLPNVGVDFKVLTGPNAGVTGTVTTDANGNAAFTYKGTSLGKDAVQATVTNASGGSFSSNTGTVSWDLLPIPILGALFPGQTPAPTSPPAPGPTPSVLPTRFVRVLPVTGENTTRWLWVALSLILGGIAITAGATLRRRN